MHNIEEGKQQFGVMSVSEEMRQKALKAFKNGVDCILKTQIKVNGQPTVWCA
jgi:pectinesterase